MARIDTLANFLTDIATAIKAKTGKTDAITPANFDTEINSIETGGGVEDLSEELNTYNTELTEQNTKLSNIISLLQTKTTGNPKVYSTEETRIGTWMDGKPLYRKVVIIDSIGSNVNLEIPYNIDDVDQIWINEGYSFASAVHETLPMNWFYTTSDFMRTWVNKNLKAIRLKEAADLTAYTGYVTLEYTKTTDTASEVE